MVTDWANLNETVNRVEQDLMENFWLSFRKRVFGGIGNLIRYNPYTGEADKEDYLPR